MRIVGERVRLGMPRITTSTKGRQSIGRMLLLLQRMLLLLQLSSVLQFFIRLIIFV